MAHKKGNINEHGLYFFQIGSRGNEVWLLLADFEARKKRLSETNKAWVSRNRASVNERQRTKKTEAQKAAAIIYLKEWRAKNVTKCR